MAVKWIEQDLKLDLKRLRESLTERIHTAILQASAEHQACIACVTVPIGLRAEWCDQALHATPSDGTGWYWREPGANGRTYLALGVTCQVRTTGDGRFRMASDAFSQERDRMVLTDLDRPRWFCGMSFATQIHQGPWQGWPDAMIVLPQFLFDCAVNGSSSLTVTEEVDDSQSAAQVVDQLLSKLQAVVDCPTELQKMASYNSLGDVGQSRLTLDDGTIYSPQVEQEASWCEGVEGIAADIRAGRYEKVVFARQTVISNAGLQQAHVALRRLRSAYPQSHGFAVHFHDACFLGASPERLVRCVDGVVSVDCLAGTTKRGTSAAEDYELGEALLRSAKDLREHDIVVQWVKHTLADVVIGMPEDTKPVLRKLPNVQHLHTPLRGEVRSGTTIFDLIERLHPTPAVAGVPREMAIEAIQEREGMDRGWYAGPVGWIDREGNGEFVVALRSALTLPDRAILFAGAGIMGDSNPRNEWTETELKLRPMRMAFGH